MGEPTRSREGDQVLMPSEVSSRVGFFDRFAGYGAHLASRAPFFGLCVLLVILWLAQGVTLIASKGHLSAFLNGRFQLEINTTTTIITFLMVALLQNSQTRSDQALQHKLNAIAGGLSDLMGRLGSAGDEEVRSDMEELRAAVGLELKESSTRNRVEGAEKAQPG